MFLVVTLGEPFKASERSALQAGIDQFELWRTLPAADLAFHSLRPDRLSRQGRYRWVLGYIRAYLPRAHWGTNPDFGPQWIGLYFRTVPEANVFHVANAGLTNYASNTTYSFLGGTAQLNATLFQNMPEFGAQSQLLDQPRRTLRGMASGRSVDTKGREGGV